MRFHDKLIIFGIVLLLAAFLLSYPPFVSQSHGATKVRFSADEQELLDMAGKEGGVELQAILLNESVAGRFGRHGDKHFKNWKSQCYGVMQVQYNTAVWIIKKFKLSNQNVKWRLQYDDAFNIHVASTYYKYLLRFFKGNKQKAILAYNTGPGNVQRRGMSFDPNNYRSKANKWISMLTNTPTTNVYHTIVKGDTLSKIAKSKLGNWRVWKSILKLNPGLDVHRLKIGTKIRIK